MSEHKSHEVIRKEVDEARGYVAVGGVYRHFKDPENLVVVMGIGVQEATDSLCVVYRDRRDGIIFVRDLAEWLREPEVGVARFTLVDEYPF